MMAVALTIEQASPSFLSYWKEGLGAFGAFSIVIGSVAVLIFDSWFMRAFERCKDRIMARLDEWYKTRIADNAEARRQVEINSDKLIAFEAAQIEQGKVIKGQLERNAMENTTALNGVTSALQAVQKEAQATAEAVARIEGFIEASGNWTGPNRRKRTRRNPGGTT